MGLQIVADWYGQSRSKLKIEKQLRQLQRSFCANTKPLDLECTGSTARKSPRHRWLSRLQLLTRQPPSLRRRARKLTRRSTKPAAGQVSAGLRAYRTRFAVGLGDSILYYTILYYTILYYTILYYTILYYTILYYTILYYTILYYTILYYTILYYTILYYMVALTRASGRSTATQEPCPAVWVLTADTPKQNPEDLPPGFMYPNMMVQGPKTMIARVFGT